MQNISGNTSRRERLSWSFQPDTGHPESEKGIVPENRVIRKYLTEEARNLIGGAEISLAPTGDAKVHGLRMDVSVKWNRQGGRVRILPQTYVHLSVPPYHPSAQKMDFLVRGTQVTFLAEDFSAESVGREFFKGGTVFIEVPQAGAYGREFAPHHSPVQRDRLVPVFSTHHIFIRFPVHLVEGTGAVTYAPVTAEGLNYDGRNHVISSVVINVNTDAALFASLTNGSRVNDLILEDFNVCSANGNAGALCASMNGGTVQNVLVYNNIKTSPDDSDLVIEGATNVGGLIGTLNNSVVSGGAAAV